jgi:hypothetical protein
MRNRGLAIAMLLLALGSAAVSVLGPLWLGLLVHRTSPTTLNQLVGADAAGLLLVAPVCVFAAVLAWRGHPAAPALALAPAVYVVYTYTQYVLGQEHLQQPGNVELFFPLLLGLVVVGGVAVVLAWTAMDRVPQPVPGRRLEVATGAVLLLLVVFLVLGLHLPGLLDALSAEPQRVEYLSSPTAFWLVKYMDLGILAPVAAVTGVGLLRHRAWARKPMYAVLGAYTLIGTSVVAMAVVMLARDDPDASVGLAAGLGVFAAVFWTLAVAAYLPLFRRRPEPAQAGPVRDDVTAAI